MNPTRRCVDRPFDGRKRSECSERRPYEEAQTPSRSVRPSDGQRHSERRERRPEYEYDEAPISGHCVDRPSDSRRRSDCRDRRAEYEYEESPMNHRENPPDAPPDGIYGAFYRIIFAFVYAILSFAMAPVTKKSKSPRRQRRQSGGSGHRRRDYYHDHESYENVEEGYGEPPRPHHTEYSPSSPVSQRQLAQGINKTVHFSQPERKTYRPPLGRVNLASKSSNSSVSSGSTSTTGSSYSSNSLTTDGFGYSSPSYRVQRSLDRILASTPRTSHSSYFVGKC